MSGHNRQVPDKVPLPFLIAAGALVGLSILLAGGFRLLKGEAIGGAHPEAVIVKSLRFEDQPNGSIAILTADGRRLEIVEPGTNGFLRGTLRALVRERRLHDVGDAPPFQLVRRADGSLTLDDPATGRSILLDAFGPANSGVFASLLTSGSKQR